MNGKIIFGSLDIGNSLDINKRTIKEFKKNHHESVGGVLFRRVIRFQGKPIRFGGVGKVPVMRLFQHGKCE
jgi:hypothetical protein